MRIRPARANSVRFNVGNTPHEFHAGQWQNVNGEGLDYLLSEYSMYPMVEEKLIGPHWIKYTGVKNARAGYYETPDVERKFIVKPGQYLKLPRHGAYQILKHKDFEYASFVELAPQFKFKNVLIIRYGGLGDVLLTTPAIRELKQMFPDIEIHYSTDDRYKVLLENNKYIDHVWGCEDIYDAGIKFDAVIDLRRCVEADKRSDEVHRAQLFASRMGLSSLKSYSLEYTLPNVLFSQSLPQLFHKHTVILQADGSSTIRSLNETQQVELAHKLVEANFNVITVGAHETDRFDTAGVLNLAGKLDIADMMYAISQGDVVVTGDSGLLHCAIALNKNIVGLFGSVAHHLRVPPDYPLAVINAADYSGCGPCSDKQLKGEECYKCLSMIPTDVIVEKVKWWFDGYSESKRTC